MKKPFISIAVLLSLLWGLAPGVTKAQNSISYGDNSAVITFNIADYTFENSDINQLNLSDKSFVSIVIADDEYGIVADDGYPAIPQLPLLINIPVNAQNVSVSMRNAVTTQQQVPTGQYIEPFVNVGKDGTIEDTGFNATYYNTATTPYVSYFYATEEPFFLFDEQALDLTILPFQYVPTTGSLTVLESAEFVITWTTEGNLATKSGTTQVREDFFKDLFMGYEPIASKGKTKGRLLIISAPQYEQGLSLFKQYKENIGIETQIVTTTTTGRTGEQIENYIKKSSFKPDFVLLVGSVSTIPAMGPEPITDDGYRSFRNNNKYGDVFLGRWPVANKTELANAINKTIIMETKLFTMERRVAILTGHGKNKDVVSYRKGNETAIKGFKKYNYQCDDYYTVSMNKIKALQNTYPSWMVYSGNSCKNGAGFNYFADTLCRTSNFITRSFFIKTDVFPLLFSFSGYDGDYSQSNSISLGVVDARGPVMYFGASSQTMTPATEVAETKILGKSLGDSYIGAIITKGMTKFSRFYWEPKEKQVRLWHLYAFNLMGDPSLNRLGYDILSAYDFNGSFTAVGGINLTFNSTNAINIYQGLSMERNASLTFKPNNQLLLKGTIATAGGKLTGESKKVTLDGSACINSGSVVNLTANEFDFQSGFTVESGSDVVFQIK